MTDLSRAEIENVAAYWVGSKGREAIIQLLRQLDAAHPVTVEMLERWFDVMGDETAADEIRATIAQMKEPTP